MSAEAFAPLLRTLDRALQAHADAYLTTASGRRSLAALERARTDLRRLMLQPTHGQDASWFARRARDLAAEHRVQASALRRRLAFAAVEPEPAVQDAADLVALGLRLEATARAQTLAQRARTAREVAANFGALEPSLQQLEAFGLPFVESVRGWMSLGIEMAQAVRERDQAAEADRRDRALLREVEEVLEQARQRLVAEQRINPMVPAGLAGLVFGELSAAPLTQAA